MDDLRENIRRELDKRLPSKTAVWYPATTQDWEDLLDDLTDGVLQVIAKAEHEKQVSEAYRVTVEDHGVGLRKPAEDFPIEWEE